jgi:hypothetical protein
MPKALAALALAAVLFAPAALPAAPGQGAGGFRIRDVLPAEGLIVSSVVAIRDQSALDAHYYLADETVLGLGRRTDAVFARYRAGAGEALVLAVAYPAAGDVARIYARFGGDFFSGKFEAGSSLFLERLETGDWGAVARTGRVLVVVLEAPDRAGCEALLRRLLEKALAADR